MRWLLEASVDLSVHSPGSAVQRQQSLKSGQVFGVVALCATSTNTPRDSPQGGTALVNVAALCPPLETGVALEVMLIMTLPRRPEVAVQLHRLVVGNIKLGAQFAEYLPATIGVELEVVGVSSLDVQPPLNEGHYPVLANIVLAVPELSWYPGRVAP